MKTSRLEAIRAAEKASHTQAYEAYQLYESGSWLAKPVKTVLELLPLFEGYSNFRALDLGCGVGRNSIPLAQTFPEGKVDCVDILPLAIQRLAENAKRYQVEQAIRGIVQPIDEFPIPRDSYDLILAISALEHVDSEEAFLRKLAQIRDGLREKGIACFVVNSGVLERDKATKQPLLPQFEVNLPTKRLQAILLQTFTGWEIRKETVVHQKYDIPRSGDMVELETDVVTFVARK